jgi:hypothetical protein
MKWGIKVPFILDHDYMWVTRGDSKFQIEPLLFENKKEAEEYALNTWGTIAIVAEYEQDQDSN